MQPKSHLICQRKYKTCTLYKKYHIVTKVIIIVQLVRYSKKQMPNILPTISQSRKNKQISSKIVNLSCNLI